VSATNDTPLPHTATNLHEMLVQAVGGYAIFMLDPEGRVASWGSGAENIKGYTAAEIIGTHFSCFYTDEDRAAGVPEQVLQTAIEKGRFSAEGWRVRKDGTRFWAVVAIDPIWVDGKLQGFAKVTRDITEQHNAQIARLEAERRFRLLVEGVTDYAIYMLSPEGRVANWNSGARRIKGYAASEIIGEHFSRFYTPEDVAAGLPFQALHAARLRGRYQAEGWRVRKDGTRFWAGIVVQAIYDDGALVGFAKITRDLTERREAQAQLTQSQQQLIQAQKMEAVGNLTGGLAHDFNNLLTGILGSLELLRLRINQGHLANLDRYLGAAHGAATRAASLTHRLLAFARRQTLEPKPINPIALIEGLEELIQRTVGPEILVGTELPSEIWSVLCDPNQLENALINLAINARDAMPSGGTLTIGATAATLDDRHALALDLSPGDYVAISVADTGSGMSPDVIAHAFEPFYTTKPAGKGTGLGLSTIYGFAQQSGGQARIESSEGIGTTVRLYLPRHSGQFSQAPLDETPLPALRVEAGATALVVDDEPSIRLLITETLEDLGYTVIEAADSVLGLKILQSDMRIDLLITDVGLPGGVNGRQMVDAIRVRRPDLPVLLISGYAENAVIGRGSLEPGVQILGKPFTTDALLRRIGAIAAPRQGAP
jgi:PAS domain S-box-containing protein